MTNTLNDAVNVREVGLRDGLQSIPQIMPTRAKIDWINAEVKAGVREIEVCSFVPPKLMPQLADAADVVQHALTKEGLTVAALIPNPRGAEIALGHGVHKLNYVISASERHNQANVRRSRAESLQGFAEVARMVKGTGTELVGGISTAFGCTIQGAISLEEVLYVARGYLDAGVDELVLADTVGYASPNAVRELVEQVRAETQGKVRLALHLHDTRGLGLANALAGLHAGIREFDASLAGLGGCPHAPGASGNIVMEDLVFLLQSLGLKTGVDLSSLVAVRDILARELPDVALLGAIGKAGLPLGFAGE